METTYRGEKAVVLESGPLRAVILPSRGGKIASLQVLDPSEHSPRAQELLIQPKGLVLPPLTPGRFGFDQSWGWDDMFPCITSGPYPFEAFRDTILPDHGELWYLGAKKVEHNNATVSMEFTGEVLPYQITKSVQVLENRLRLTWTLTNSCDQRLYFFWAAHPLFDVPEDCFFSGPGRNEGPSILNAFDHPTLPGYAREYGFPLAHLDSATPKSETTTTRQLNRMPAKNDPGAMKYYFAHKISEAELPLVIHQKSRGLELRLTYDREFLPYLGMWINGNGWSDQYTMAPEPATGIMDSLHAAKEYGTAACIQARSSQTWWMEMEVVSLGG